MSRDTANLNAVFDLIDEVESALRDGLDDILSEPRPPVANRRVADEWIKSSRATNR